MDARAHLRTELEVRPDGHAHTRIAALRSQAPLDLRPTHPKGPEPWIGRDAGAARVCLTAGAAGPVGGDRLSLTVHIGAASTLILRDVSATLVLPGPRGAESRLEIALRVGADATLVWLPEPIIAARGCRHGGDVRIALDPGARLLAREELLLGRHGEEPGSLCQRIRVRRDGRPLLSQELALGPDAPAFAGPAVTGGHRAIGSLLAVDPAWEQEPPSAIALEGDAAVMPLAGPAALVSALCPDALRLRRTLDAGLVSLGGPGVPARQARASGSACSKACLPPSCAVSWPSG